MGIEAMWLSRIYGDLWIIAWEFLTELVQELMNLTLHKLPHYSDEDSIEPYF